MDLGDGEDEFSSVCGLLAVCRPHEAKAAPTEPAAPVLEVSAGMVLTDGVRALLIRRGGALELPKGHVEAGEAVAEAAYREAREETGLSSPVEPRDAVHTAAYSFTKKRGGVTVRKSVHYLRFVAAEGAPLAFEGPREAMTKELRWVTLEELRGCDLASEDVATAVEAALAQASAELAEAVGRALGLAAAAFAGPPQLPEPPVLDGHEREIAALLTRLERERNVRILFAAEKSSRTFGTCHRGSDHDIKVIFVPNNGLATYLSLKPVETAFAKFELQRPNIEVSGWELRHAFQLVAQSNPTMLEILLSPLVYRSPEWLPQLRAAVDELFDRGALARSLLHHAFGNFRQYLQRAEGNIKRKKYTHVLRALLTSDLLLTSARTPGSPWPPLRLHELVAQSDLPPPVFEALSQLLEDMYAERPLGPRVKVLDAFILGLVERLSARTRLMPDKPNDDAAWRKRAALNLERWDAAFLPVFGSVLGVSL